MVQLALTKKDNGQIDIHSRNRREERNGTLQAQFRGIEVPGFTKSHPEEGMCVSGSGLKLNAFAQLRNCPILRAAVPERNAEVIVRIGKVRPQSDRSFQVGQGPRQVALLAQNEAEHVVRCSVWLVQL